MATNFATPPDGYTYDQNGKLVRALDANGYIAYLDPKQNAASHDATASTNWVGTDQHYYGPGPDGQWGGPGGTPATGNLQNSIYGQLAADKQSGDGSGLTWDYLSTLPGKLGSAFTGWDDVGKAFGLDPAQTQTWLTQHGMPGAPKAQEPAPGQPNAAPERSAPTLAPYQKNPYLDDMAAGLTRNAVDTWTRQIDPSIRSGAMAAGGFGGSRQGVVEANALNDWSNNLSDSLANLYGNDYQQAMGRNLAKYQADLSYDLGLGNLALGNQNSSQNYALGMGNLGLGYLNANNSHDLGLRNNDLGYANLDASIAQRNADNSLAGANFGLSLWDRLLASNKGGTDTAATAQNAPLTYQQLLSALAGQFGALGGTTASSAAQSNDLLAGLLKGSALGNDLYSYFTKDH